MSQCCSKTREINNHRDTSIVEKVSIFFFYTSLHEFLCSSLNCHLTVVEGFEYPNDPRSYVVWGYMPLVGSPKANRS